MEKAEADRDRDLKDKYSLDVTLVPEDAHDRHMAELLQYRTVTCTLHSHFICIHGISVLESSRIPITMCGETRKIFINFL